MTIPDPVSGKRGSRSVIWGKTLLAAHKVIGFKTDWVLTKKATKGPVAEKIRQAMDMPITVEFKKQPAEQVFKDLLDKYIGVPVLYHMKPPGRSRFPERTLSAFISHEARPPNDCVDKPTRP